MNFNAVMDFFSNQILLPLGGLFIAIFSGWFMQREYARDEFTTLSAAALRALVASSSAMLCRRHWW
jgi:SNF family Na+-dependent transporter